MSVLKMIIADDRHYISGEPHGSVANRIYTACARNPASLDELDRLLQEFGATERLRDSFGWASSLDFTPVDAGLIIIDLAKKWIFAENTYFSASRRGSYSPIGLGAQKFAYEFSEKWHFVAEAKWFNYLFSCDLQPFFKRGMNDTGVIGAGAISQPVSLGESGGGEPERHWEDQLEALEAMPEDIEEEEEMWDDERAGIEVEYINRVTMLIYFEPQNAAEERDLQTLEHIIRYEQKAAVCEHQIQQARQEISALQIELQAAENLRNRTAEPRWERKCIHFQTLIGQQEKHIANLMCKQDEAAAMAAELRTLGSSEKYQETLKSWQDED